ncbi:hypothetical protein N9K49_05770 [Flavobacteriaceae bacterium]|nr:hypothetical protein [Flavobacteriaceae bacterium]
MKTKITLLIAFLFLSITTIFSQNEKDLETLSIFSELAKSKNYTAAYTPWMEIRNRNPKFNKAIFVYGERILDYKIDNSEGEEKISFIKDMLKLWKERKAVFPNVTPSGTYMAKACQLEYDYREILNKTNEVLYACFDTAYTTDAKTFTNPKSLYTYFSLMVDLYDANVKTAQQLFSKYDDISEKVEFEVKNYTTKRNAYLDEEGQVKELAQKEARKLKSYDSYLRAYDKIAGSIDTKLGSRANCENLIPLYQRDFQ